MGAIHFSIDPLLAGLLASRLDLSVFIETGTFHGDSVAVVRQFFKEIHTCELSPELYAAAAQRFANDPVVGCHLASSSDWLPTIVPRYSGRPVMFWLDAHWCVAGHTKGEESQCPLLDELKALGPLHADSVIWIDDARYFTAPPPQPLQAKGWPTFQQVLERLQSLSKVHHVVLADDTILFYPQKVSSEVAEYLHVHGTDWLAIAHNSRLIPELNQGLQAKEKALQETHKAREEAQTKATELNQQLTAKEKALQETHHARKEAEKQAQELNGQLNAKEKALQKTHKAREEAHDKVIELDHKFKNIENKLDEKTRLSDAFISKLDKDLSVWKDDLSENTKLIKMILLVANPVFYFATRVILRPIYLKRLMLSLPETSITEKKQDTRINLSDKRPDSVDDGPTLRLRQGLEAKELVIQNLLLERQAWRVAGFLFWPLQRLVRYLIKKKKEITGTRLGKLRQHPPESFVFHIRSTPKMQGLIPTVSVVTPAYNQADFLPQTIDSVLGQGYPGLQYVVQDGGSKDGSPELIRSHESRLHAWESIADRGQAHALNLGFRKTSGEIMGWLNADDLHTPNTLWTVARFFQRNPQVDVVYGHRMIINEKNHKIGIWIMPDHSERILSWADYIPQETLFWRRGIWEKAGGMMNESFHFALDWDLILRFRRAGARFFRIPELLGCFRVHDKQKTSQLLDSRGKEEMDLLRQQVHGIIPTEEEIWHQTKGYLSESVGSHLGWRMSQLWKRVVLMEKRQTLFP